MTMQGDDEFFNRIQVLWEHPFEFFPDAQHTASERLNAMVRLVMYSTGLIAMFRYFKRGDMPGAKRALFVGVAIVGLFSALHLSESYTGPPNHKTKIKKWDSCTMPSRGNPFANKLYGDPSGQPRACGYADGAKIAATTQRQVSKLAPHLANDRQFMTTAVSSGIPDTQKFRDFVYGGRVTCKESSEACMPTVIRSGRPR